MALTAGRAGLAAAFGTALLVGSLASASAAPAAADQVLTYRTVSGSALCPPAGEECFTPLLDGQSRPARVNSSSAVVVQTGQLPDSGPAGRACRSTCSR